MKNTRLVTLKSAMDGDALLLTLYYGNKKADKALLWYKDYDGWDHIRSEIENFRLYGLDESANTFDGDVV